VSAVVDAHVHLLPDRLAAAIRRFFEERMPSYCHYPYPWEQARAAVVAAGVARCWSLPYAHRPDVAAPLNRWMAEAFHHDPVVVPGGTVHPGDDVAGVVREALVDLRLRVLKIHCSVGAFTADDERLDPLWREASARATPVVVHLGHAVDGTTTAEEVAPIADVARRWPDARIVVAHCGAPAVAPVLALLRATRAVHADLTPVGARLAALDAAALAGLEDRILFGSDAPNTGSPIERSVAHVRALGLAPDAEVAILGGNALRLLAPH
jgi:predicted TIM-barrel fold metal-dependent hydrolase